MQNKHEGRLAYSESKRNMDSGDHPLDYDNGHHNPRRPAFPFEKNVATGPTKCTVYA